MIDTGLARQIIRAGGSGFVHPAFSYAIFADDNRKNNCAKISDTGN